MSPASSPASTAAEAPLRPTIDPAFWSERRVLLTGHTGFKGAWLSLWLARLGARVTGFANGIPTQPSLYELARVSGDVDDVVGDVRDADAVLAAVRRSEPELVIHMAAQSLVGESLTRPRETFETNVMGTVNVLEAVRKQGGVRVLINVTSDKCYENDGRSGGYGESDPMGGSDPYSSSKGCAELITNAYRRTFFAHGSPADGSARIASARAGNAIGGGDWAPDRLVPDAMRSALAKQPLLVRNPRSVRPWQHVLNPLSGYLRLAQALWASDEYARGWNFGPDSDEARSVEWIVERLTELWPGELRWRSGGPPVASTEAGMLSLDSSLARTRLGWIPPLDLAPALSATVEWYSAYAASADMRAATLDQINRVSEAIAAR